MEEKLEFEDFRIRFGAWAEMFKPFIESKEMFDIFQKLKEDAWEMDAEGNLLRRKEIICPASGDTFRCFATSNPEHVKVVVYLLDPYPRMYKGKIMQATGIAMDCSNSPEGRLQPSLEKFYEAIEEDLGNPVERSPDLQYLQAQGVMLLNTELTCKLNKTGSHTGLWAPFQKFFLEEVMRGKKIIYVLCGKESLMMEKYISPFGNTIIKLDHPSYAARMKTSWKTNKVFTRINKILQEDGKAPILWNKREWEADLPF